MTKYVFPSLLLLVLTACSALDEPLDEQIVMQLKGKWQQVDGRASLTVYIDEQVKLVMPDEQPPLRLLSSLEKNKDHGVGFSVGDRWGGPVYVIRAPDRQHLKLKFPPDDPRKDDGRVLEFVRTD